MAFALSSLLNPTSSENEPKPVQQDTSDQTSVLSPEQGREDLSPTHKRSPELLHSQIPKYTPPQRPRLPSNSTGGGSGSATFVNSDGTPVLEHVSIQSDFENSVKKVGEVSAGDRPDEVAIADASPALERNGVASYTDSQFYGAGARGTQMLDTERDGDTILSSAPPAMRTDVMDGEVGYGAVTPVVIKQEVEQGVSPVESRSLSLHISDVDHSANRNLTSLKQEHASRTQSPLRESSIALPTTEDQVSATGVNMKKRPAPAKAKKGTATTAKKPKAPSKKRKTDKLKPVGTKGGSSRGTPATFSPASSEARSFSPGADDDEDHSEADSDDDVEGSGDVYCICRKPDNGTFMIGCDGQCDDWFHGKCVGIEERDKNLMDKYICPSCTKAGVGRTSWKRMCRRLGCRLPARVGRNAHKDGTTSKYCSDECGVLFFREMSARTRGREQSKKSRRKGIADDQSLSQDDGHARGGILSTGEVKALLDLSNTATDFKAFGNGVLSPPPTPNGQETQSSAFTDTEREKLKEIEAKKDEARLRHRSLKDRLLFVGYVKTEAVRAAAASDLKPKEYCGFDPRINWSEEEFSEWRQSPQGQATFEQGSLEQLANGVSEPKAEADGDSVPSAADENNQIEPCSRKKCARHADWSKLAVDEIRFEMTDNSDHMRSLEQQEQEIKAQASTRAKQSRTDGEGTVEWHQDISPQAGLDNAQPNNDVNTVVPDPMQLT